MQSLNLTLKHPSYLIIDHRLFEYALSHQPAIRTRLTVTPEPFTIPDSSFTRNLHR